MGSTTADRTILTLGLIYEYVKPAVAGCAACNDHFPQVYLPRQVNLGLCKILSANADRIFLYNHGFKRKNQAVLGLSYIHSLKGIYRKLGW